LNRPRAGPIIRRESPFGSVGPSWIQAYDVAGGRVFRWNARVSQFHEIGYPDPAPRIRVQFEWKREGRLFATAYAARARLIYAAAHGLCCWEREFRMMDVHHMNGNCGDDRIENLEFLDPTTHRLLELDRQRRELEKRIAEYRPQQFTFWDDR
jgi:hypothetical protein